MAILRTHGFPTFSLAGYLLVQAAGITCWASCWAALFTLVFTISMRLTVSSFTIVPRLDAGTLLPGLGWICLMMLAGSLLPAWWLRP